MDYTPDQRVSSLTPAWELQGFRLPAECPDVRGWHVKADDGTLVGSVSRLIVDTRTRIIRYVAVRLSGRFGKSTVAEPRTVLVPVGVVRRLDDEQALTLEHITPAQLARAPRLPFRAIMRADEVATLAAFGLAALWDFADALYATPIFDTAPLLR